jgi:hypothetical protein
MEPIISPWFFYVRELFAGLNTITWALCWASFVISFVCVIVLIVDSGIEEKERLSRKIIGVWAKTLRISGPITVIMVLILLIVPTKETFTNMCIAKNITYERVGKAKDIAGDIKDEIKKDIFDMIDKIKKEE